MYLILTVLINFLIKRKIYNVNYLIVSMSWFKKRRDIIDLTYLAKRGLIKPNEEFKEIMPQQTETNDSSALGFLGAMASSAEPTETNPSSTASSAGISKNKIEDIEYKLDIISKRVNSMIDRLDLVEKKLSRDLRQGV